MTESHPTPRSSAQRPPPTPGRLSAARNALRAVGRTPLFLIRHMTKLHHIQRRKRSVTELSEPLPSLSNSERLQTTDDGVGPVVFRQYVIDIEALDNPNDPDRPALGTSVVGAFASDPNQFADTSMAAFMVDDAPASDLRVGDRLVVELAGPWNGPVEVLVCDDEQLLLGTLDGHMEAGLIRFDLDRCSDEVGNELVRFRITSWARAGDPVFKLFHLSIPLGRELQTAMWVALCRSIAAHAGRAHSRVDVVTEILERDSKASRPPHDDTPRDPRGSLLQSRAS